MFSGFLNLYKTKFLVIIEKDKFGGMIGDEMAYYT